MAKSAKKSLAGALARHHNAQELKAKQKAAEEARERRAEAIEAQQHGPKRRKRGTEGVDASTAAEGATGSVRPGQPRRQARLVDPFERDDTILLVGEGNFSFTLSLLQAPHNLPPHQILATAYDSEEDCYTKYPDARGIVAQIRALAGRDDVVEFGVDAGNLQAHKSITGVARERKRSKAATPVGDPEEEMTRRPRPGAQMRRWSKIWFGFPHVGAGHKDEARNVLANQLLLARFILSAAPLLTAGPLPQYARGESKPKPASDASDDDASDGPDDSTVHAKHTNEVGNGDWDATAFQPAPSQGVMPFKPPSKAGSILITVRNAHPYTLWAVPMLAKRLGTMLGPIARSAPPLPKGVQRPRLEAVARELGGDGMRLWRSYEFDPLAWPGYTHRRTVGWVEGISTSNNEDLVGRAKPPGSVQGRAGKHEGTGECRTYQFGLVFMDPRARQSGAGSKKRRKVT